MIPTAMQFIPAVGILALVPLTPESPRWLIFKGRPQEAKKNLDKIRRKEEVANGATAAEADALELVVEESLATETASWLDLFRRGHIRQTWVSTERIGWSRASADMIFTRLLQPSSSSSRPTATSLFNLTPRPFTFRKASEPCPSLTQSLAKQ